MIHERIASVTSLSCGWCGEMFPAEVEHRCPALRGSALERRLTELEDRVTTMAMREHRHADHPDGYQSAYVEGYQAGFAAARTEMQTLLIEMGNKPIPAGHRVPRIDGPGPISEGSDG